MKILWSLLLVILLSACGFHLRNQHVLPASIHCIKITGAPYDVESALRRTLEQMNVRVIRRSGGNAPYVIHIYHSALYQDVPTIGGSNQARVFVYYFEVTFGVFDGSGHALVAPQKAKTSESLIINAGTALESTAQLELLRMQLHEEIAHMIVNSLLTI